MRSALIAGAVAATCLAHAQIPEISLKFDATVSYVYLRGTPAQFNYYDILGRPSIVGLSFYTEQGFRAYAAEKLELMPGDPSNDPFDEYYFEDQGIWRLGKQYLPFGSGKILHESAIAARGDTEQISEGLPVSVAICDGGEGLQSGAIGRIGSLIGASFAFGRHFGIAATSLDDIRMPSDAPGEGHGWREAFGLDAERRLTHWTFRAEAVTLQLGETASDRDMTIVELAATLDAKPGESTTFAWTQLTPGGDNFFRLGGAFAIDRHVSFEPMIRFRNGDLYDISAEIRVRL